MRNYKDYQVWEKSHALVKSIYEITYSFPESERYNLISQMRRAATSIPTNIAEGTGKFTDKDFLKYLHQALGSTHEVEYLLLLSFELSFLKETEFNSIDAQLNDVKSKLINLIKKIRGGTK